jgi:DNA-binding NtrC family response regulator
MTEPKAGEPGGFGPRSEANASTQNAGSHLVVLAIDDDLGMLRFYEAALAKEGVRVEGAPDPHRGLEMLQALDPHLILLDLTMPGIDGMEVLHRIRDRNDLARVVMVTGNYSIETAVKAIQEGAAESCGNWWKKPEDFWTLSSGQPTWNNRAWKFTTSRA